MTSAKPNEECVSKRKKWLRVSNADQSSLSIETENWLLDLAILRSLMTLKRANSIE